MGFFDKLKDSFSNRGKQIDAEVEKSNPVNKAKTPGAKAKAKQKVSDEKKKRRAAAIKKAAKEFKERNKRK